MTKFIGATLLFIALATAGRADTGIGYVSFGGSVSTNTPVVISTQTGTTHLPMKYYALQVKASTGAASAWDIRLEGSLDGANWTGIMSHSTPDGDGVMKVSTSPVVFPATYLRVRLNSLTFGSSATSLAAKALGIQ